MKKILQIGLILSLFFSIYTLSAHDLKGAVASDDRSPKNIIRDNHRNPLETLSFFGLESNMVIVELSPGGGWYTEILANFIHYPGTLIAAHFSSDSERAYFKRSRSNFEKKMASDSMYGRVEIVDLDSELSDPSTVDAVLNNRNIQNWLGKNMDSIISV